MKKCLSIKFSRTCCYEYPLNIAIVSDVILFISFVAVSEDGFISARFARIKHLLRSGRFLKDGKASSMFIFYDLISGSLL